MENNITRDDLDKLIEFLKEDPILTQSKNVEAFEEEWSNWLGVKHSVFVNSGSSANQISMSVLKHLHGGGEIILPTPTWQYKFLKAMAPILKWPFQIIQKFK